MAVKTKSERGPAGTLTVDDLTRAIKNSIDRTGMKEEEARAMAQHVLNFFGYSERIIDNVLEPEDRDAFYMLEDSGILTTEREETTLYDGREWRIHYWMFRKERIAELVEAQKAKEEAEKMGSVYDDVPVASHEVHRERMGQCHPSVPERERSVELLDGPQRLRAEFVREIGAVRVRGGDEGEGQSKVVRFFSREDRRIPVEGRPIEWMRIPLPRPARRPRFGEETPQAFLLDDEPYVQPAEFERDPAIERTGGGHGDSNLGPRLSFARPDSIFNPYPDSPTEGADWQPA